MSNILFDFEYKTPVRLLLENVHSVRGQSGFYDLALTERNMQVTFNLKLSVCSLGVEI